MQPLVIEYLKTHSFQQLEDDHGVCARPSNDGSKFSCNYDQILIKNGDFFAEQCRGMVIAPKIKLDVEGDWKNITVGDVDLLAWPMNRFYNHGDPFAANIDWTDSSLKIYEKIDGTMICFHYDPIQNRWHAATRSVPEADLPIRKGHIEIGDTTFSELFTKALHNVEGWQNFLNKEVTYVFELTSQYNRVVVKYDSPSITLLAARHLPSGKELDIHNLNLPFKKPQTWSINNINELDAFVQQADPAKMEGAVVCDSSFKRIKVKSKAWVLSSRMKDLATMSRRGALELIILEKLDDVIPIIEKDIGMELMKMQIGYLKFCYNIDSNFHKFKDASNGSRKDFAELVMKSGDWTPSYFVLLDKKANTTREWLLDMVNRGKLSDTSKDSILARIN